MFSGNISGNMRVNPGANGIRSVGAFSRFCSTCGTRVSCTVTLLIGTSGTVSVTRTRETPLPFLTYVISSYVGEKGALRRKNTMCGFANPRKFNITGVTSTLCTMGGLICSRGGVAVRSLGVTLDAGCKGNLDGRSITRVMSRITSTVGSTKRPMNRGRITTVLGAIITTARSRRIGTGNREVLGLVSTIPGFKGSVPRISTFTESITCACAGPLRGCGGPHKNVFRTKLCPMSTGMPLNKRAKTAPSKHLTRVPMTSKMSPSTNGSMDKPATTTGSISELSRCVTSGKALFGRGFRPSTLDKERKLRGFMKLVRSCFSRGKDRVRFGIIDHRALLSTRGRPRRCGRLIMHMTKCDTLFAALSGSLRSSVVHEARRKFWRWRKSDVRRCLGAGKEVFSVRQCSVRSKGKVQAVIFLGNYILEYH